MLFDWFTIIAQIVNFLILMFLLRRFLYKPIINTMEAREQRIASLLDEAEQKRKAAEDERQRFVQKNADWQANLDRRKQEIEEDLDNWRKVEMHAARQQVDRTLESWFKTVEDHKSDFLNDLNQFTVQKTFAIARQAVQDLASADFEAQMIQAFLSNLKRNTIDLSDLVSGDDRGGNGALRVRSAFELDSSTQKKLQSELHTYLRDGASLQFETAPNLVAGIELVGANGYTAAWNLSRYLESLQTELEHQMHNHLRDRTVSAVAENVEPVDDR